MRSYIGHPAVRCRRGTHVAGLGVRLAQTLVACRPGVAHAREGIDHGAAQHKALPLSRGVIIGRVYVHAKRLVHS